MDRKESLLHDGSDPPDSEEELPEDLDDDEDDPEDPEDTEEVSTKTTPPPAPTIAAPPKKTRKRKLAKGHNVGGDRSGVVMGAAPQDVWPLEANQVWEMVLEEAAKIQRTSHDIYISVERLSIEGYASEPVFIGEIEGDAVAGGETVAPGTALTNYMIEVFHARAQGPAKYRLVFNWKRGRSIKMGQYRFAHPHEIMQQRAWAAARSAQANMPSMAGAPPVGVGAYPPGAYPPGGYPPGYQAAQAAYPMPSHMQQPPYASQYPPQQQHTPAADPALMAELSYLRGSLQEALTAAREGRQPNIAPPPPPAAMPSVEQEDARVARVVVGVLQSYGFKPGAQAAASQPQPSIGFGSVVDRAKEQIGGLRQLASIFHEVEKLRSEMGFGGAEEAPQEVVAEVQDKDTPAFAVRPIPFAKFQDKQVFWPQREEEESLLMEWLPKFLASNPEMAGSLLEKAMRVLDQGAFGTLLGKLATQGGPAGQAAQVMSDRMNGMGVSGPPGNFGRGGGSGVGGAPAQGYPAP